MRPALSYISITNFTTEAGVTHPYVEISYEHFGMPLGQTYPVVLINHALTGNSTVCGEEGWWPGLVGYDKCIDLGQYAVICFNIVGNGYDGKPENLWETYKSFTARDVAHLFYQALQQVQVTQLYAAIGGSVGGGIAWEMAAAYPDYIRHLIPIATDWKSSDWIIANCMIQEQILNNSSQPLYDARLHAMLVYRTPESFKMKFNRTQNEATGQYNIESWLTYHGKKLEKRFQLQAYRMMNYILSTIDITKGRGTFAEVVRSIQSEIHLISIDKDYFFTLAEDQSTVKDMKKAGRPVTHHVINSIHGHDAFLIEYEQLTAYLAPIFQKEHKGVSFV